MDVSIVTYASKTIITQAIRGDSHLGGEDFTNCLYTVASRKIKELYKDMPDFASNPKSISKLKQACEKAKRALSKAKTYTMRIDALIDNNDIKLDITREEFERAAKRLLARIRTPIEGALSDFEGGTAGIAEIICVGGSSRMPMVQNTIMDVFQNRILNHNVHADEAIAMGAAIYGQYKSDSSQLTKLDIISDINPYLPGMLTCEDVVGTHLLNYYLDIFIRRNTQLPTQREKLYITHDPDATYVDIEVYQGKNIQNMASNTKLAQYRLEVAKPALH